MKLEVTQENVIKAAANCSQAEKVLKALFPTAFEQEYLYKKLRFKPGTRWKHSSYSEEFIYLGDTPELGRALGFTTYRAFYSIHLKGSGFVFSEADSNDLQLVE